MSKWHQLNGMPNGLFGCFELNKGHLGMPGFEPRLLLVSQRHGSAHPQNMGIPSRSCNGRTNLRQTSSTHQGSFARVAGHPVTFGARRVILEVHTSTSSRKYQRVKRYRFALSARSPARLEIRVA